MQAISEQCCFFHVKTLQWPQELLYPNVFSGTHRRQRGMEKDPGGELVEQQCWNMDGWFQK